MKRELYRSRASFAHVDWAMVGHMGGNITLATVFDWVTWKSEQAHSATVDADGRTWYSASIRTLADEMQTSEKVVRSAINKLVELGHLEERSLYLDGPYDRTKSYAPKWVEDVPDPLPYRANGVAQAGKCTFAPQGECSSSYNEVEDMPIEPDEHAHEQAPWSIENAFAKFWDVWPRKVSKLAAQKAFRSAVSAAIKLDRQVLADQITNAVPLAVKQWAKEGRVNAKIPYPATWLNAGGWMDEFEASSIEPESAYANVKEFEPDVFD